MTAPDARPRYVDTIDPATLATFERIAASDGRTSPAPDAPAFDPLDFLPCQTIGLEEIDV